MNPNFIFLGTKDTYWLYTLYYYIHESFIIIKHIVQLEEHHINTKNMQSNYYKNFNDELGF